MTKAEKKRILIRLFRERSEKEGRGVRAELARSLNVSAEQVGNLLHPTRGWTSAKKEVELWRFFGWTLNERGEPIPNAEGPASQERGNIDFDKYLADLALAQATIENIKAGLERLKKSQ
jgi:hypothetical protein